MRLTDLLNGKIDSDLNVAGVTADSRQVKPGYLFAALPGNQVDGRDYAEDAIRNGAVAILSTDDFELYGQDQGKDVVVIQEDNPRLVFSQIAACFYQSQPDRIVAVTGTNGKTSVVSFVQQLWALLGYDKSVSVGTLGVRGPGLIRSGSHTTPDPASLHAELADLAAAGIERLSIEASSHGLDQYRLHGLGVSAAAFTNLTQDHLDYHPSMEHYFQSKAKLFAEVMREGGIAVLNADSDYFQKMKAVCEARNHTVISYGKNGDDICLKALEPKPDGLLLSFEFFGKSYDVHLPLIGFFQAHNVMCAMALVLSEWGQDSVKVEKLVSLLSKLQGVPGRMQLVPGHAKGAAVYVDYAHTPDALQNLLEALRPHTEKRLVCLIGCGGDRDSTKRPIMGRIAAELADIALISDDNPRSEDPAKIRAMMVAGTEGIPAQIKPAQIEDIDGRAAAIERGIALIGEGDVFVLAGKGHESGQTIGGRCEPFDDTEEAIKAMKKLNLYKEGV